MRKFLTSSVFILAFGAYGLYQYFANTSQASVNSPAPTSASSEPVAYQTPASSPPSVPVTASSGQYKDGIYTGSVADAYYGFIQVKATIANGKITDIAFLQYPNDRDDSRYINGQAMPVLKSEAIRAQSAKVNTVSGASDTSAAFRESLSAALAKARA